MLLEGMERDMGIHYVRSGLEGHGKGHGYSLCEKCSWRAWKGTWVFIL